MEGASGIDQGADGGRDVLSRDPVCRPSEQRTARRVNPPRDIQPPRVVNQLFGQGGVSAHASSLGSRSLSDQI